MELNTFQIKQMSILEQYIYVFDMEDNFKFSDDKNDYFNEENCIKRLKSTHY